MKIKYFFFLGFISCFLFSTAQKRPKQDILDEFEIQKVMDKQETAWNEGNVEKFMEGYWNNDSLSFVGKSGITFGWKATLSNYKKNYPDKETMGKLAFEIIKRERLGPESYLVIGKWSLQRTKDNVGGHFSLVWRKINGKWLIISDHTS